MLKLQTNYGCNELLFFYLYNAKENKNQHI